MKGKRFWIGWIVVFVVYELVGFVLHNVLLAPQYKALETVWRPEPEMMAKMWIMWITALVWTWLFCYIFTRGYEGRGLMEGVRYGLIIGLFMSVPFAYESYVIYPITATLAHLWFIAGLVTSVILGVVFAAIYRPAEA